VEPSVLSRVPVLRLSLNNSRSFHCRSQLRFACAQNIFDAERFAHCRLRPRVESSNRRCNPSQWAYGSPCDSVRSGASNPDGTLNVYDKAIWGAGGKLCATFDAEFFDPNSNTVVSLVIPPELYQIDPSTGTATLVRATDHGIGAVVEIDGTSCAFDVDTDQITSFDLSSGHTTFMSNFDLRPE
jgi:hypothetical protein